jgi:xanthine dehydrogenase accessory factor
MMGGVVTDVEDVLATAASWLDGEGDIAVATVVRTWGSSPRQPGSQLAITRSGRMAGSVSGGCIEVAVAEAAQSVLESGRAQVLSFGVSDERAWEVGLACGGQVQVLIERISRDDVTS